LSKQWNVCNITLFNIFDPDSLFISNLLKRLRTYIYTSVSIASISFTGQMKFIPRWTSLALSPRKGTENTDDVRNSPLFLECCYLKIASTRCKAILIASQNRFCISQYRRRLSFITKCSCYSVYLTVLKGAQPSQNKQVLMVCVALWRHSTFTGSKHDAAVLTDFQDVPQTLLKETQCYIGYKW